MPNIPDHLGGTIKLLLALLAFTLVMQISAGGKCADGGRSTRSTHYVESRLKDFIDFAKDVVEQSGMIITAVLDKIPVTEEYIVYREELEAFLLKLDRYKAQPGQCAKKSLELMTTFLMLTTSYEQGDKTAEAEDVYTIMKSSGLPELEKKATDWMNSIDEDRFQSEYKEMLTHLNSDVASIFMEIC